jgi:hypothetical protein
LANWRALCVAAPIEAAPALFETAQIHVEADRGDPERLSLILPGAEAPVAPTHWSFGQLASQVGAPASYLRQLPAAIAGINLQYGLTSHRAEQIKTPVGRFAQPIAQRGGANNAKKLQCFHD